jgi:catechol 2,3-dioxygenase-like lactoylglutathione lyase family enzyme
MTIIGAHAMMFTKDADSDRAFLRDVIGLKAVDAGEGWLIFALPPSEMGVHPHEQNDVYHLYFMTDDVEAEIAGLRAKGVACDDIADRGWGLISAVSMPSGGKLALYQPRHPLAHG